MRPILDRPMASCPSEQLIGAGQLARGAGDKATGIWKSTANLDYYHFVN
jgi:hypothetical protein